MKTINNCLASLLRGLWTRGSLRVHIEICSRGRSKTEICCSVGCVDCAWRLYGTSKTRAAVVDVNCDSDGRSGLAMCKDHRGSRGHFPNLRNSISDFERLSRNCKLSVLEFIAMNIIEIL